MEIKIRVGTDEGEKKDIAKKKEIFKKYGRYSLLLTDYMELNKLNNI